LVAVQPGRLVVYAEFFRCLNALAALKTKIFPQPLRWVEDYHFAEPILRRSVGHS
jgi:hypothetical protein